LLLLCLCCSDKEEERKKEGREIATTDGSCVLQKQNRLSTMATTAAPTTELSSLSLNQTTNCNLSTVNFAIEIPEGLIALPDLNLKQNGVVGTITFLKNSAMVWIGWGNLIDDDGETQSQGCGMPCMGPMVVAMPRTKYAGMSSGDEAPCSQMIGGDNEEEVMMGNTMAMRLAKKIGWPIFVSCSLGEMGNIRSRGMSSGSMMGELQGSAFDGDMGSLAVHAAALAEKEVGRIITERKNQLTS